MTAPPSVCGDAAAGRALVDKGDSGCFKLVEPDIPDVADRKRSTTINSKLLR